MSTSVISGREVKPFTDEERAFAAQHHGLVDKYLSRFRLPADEWYDVAVFGFLRATRNWIRRPELHKYQFSTIAFRAMSSSVLSERDMQNRRIQTMSLDAVLQGTDNFTLADVVTERHLNFVPYLMEDEMKITYNVELPKFTSNKETSEENKAVMNFLKSNFENLCFEYDMDKEAKNRASAMREFRKRKGWQNFYNINRVGNKVYVTRGEKEVPRE